jgi:hypothetical protein
MEEQARAHARDNHYITAHPGWPPGTSTECPFGNSRENLASGIENVPKLRGMAHRQVTCQRSGSCDVSVNVILK